MQNDHILTEDSMTDTGIRAISYPVSIVMVCIADEEHSYFDEANAFHVEMIVGRHEKEE